MKNNKAAQIEVQGLHSYHDQIHKQDFNEYTLVNDQTHQQP